MVKSAPIAEEREARRGQVRPPRWDQRTKRGRALRKQSRERTNPDGPEQTERAYPAIWEKETGAVREYLDNAFAEGLRLNTGESDRRTLKRYRAFVRIHFHKDIPEAGWRECAAYRTHLLGQDLKKKSIAQYVGVVRRYYLLRARRTGDPRAFDTYAKLQVVGRNLPHSTGNEGHAPFSLETLRRIIRAVRSYKEFQAYGRRMDSEDEVVIMLLLYTAGRSAFYGLRLREIDFDRLEIRTRTKGGRLTVIPLHPTLAEVLRRHLATRKYKSPYLFRNAGDPTTLEGQIANRRNAWYVCKRVQRAAALTESVYPYRFRRTFAVMARELGMDVQQVQVVLGHTNVLTTYDIYARPRMEEVKKTFAGVDLLRPQRKAARFSTAKIAAALRELAPAGKEEAWAILVQGFTELLRGRRGAEELVPLSDIWSATFRNTRT
jgi:integrase